MCVSRNLPSFGAVSLERPFRSPAEFWASPHHRKHEGFLDVVHRKSQNSLVVQMAHKGVRKKEKSCQTIILYLWLCVCGSWVWIRILIRKNWSRHRQGTISHEKLNCKVTCSGTTMSVSVRRCYLSPCRTLLISKITLLHVAMKGNESRTRSLLIQYSVMQCLTSSIRGQCYFSFRL